MWYEQVEETDDADEGFWIGCAFEVPVAKLQNLLWCALVTDFGAIRPNLHCLIYLVDAARLRQGADGAGVRAYCAGAVARSSSLNQRIACSRLEPHMSADGCKPPQNAGRSGLPKMRHRLSSAN